MSPVSVLTGLNQIAPQGPDEWTPRDVHDDAPDELTLRAALIESNNRAATLLQQNVGTRRVLKVASDAGLRRPAGCAIARPRLRSGDAARDHRGVLRLSQRRPGRAAARHHARA